MTNWKTYKIGDLCRISSSKRIFAKEYKDSGIPFYRGKEIIEKQKGNKISTELYISQERYDEIKAKHGVPQKGDMLLTSVGTLGIPYIVQDEVFYFKDGNLTWFYDFEELDSRYLYYWFLSPIGKMNIDSKAIGSTQKALTIETLSKFEISLPPLEEQRRIAGILGAIDDKIENNRRINTNLELQAQALYKQWFVDFEFPNEEGKPYKSSGGKMVDSELGQIPDGWNNIRFSKFCHLSNDRVGGLCVSDYSITNNGITPRGQKYTKQLSQNRAENKLLRKGNLAFGMSRDILNWGIMKDEIGAVSPAYTVYTIGDIDVTYLELYIQSHIAYFRDLIKPAAREGQSIDKGVLNNKMLYYPPKHLLRAFLAIFNSISNNFCIKENETLATLRDTLLPKLMNGEIKL